jgi:hypothetical protein
MFKWRWQMPSRDGDFHVAPSLLSDQDMAEIRAANPRPGFRMCRHGHRVEGDNAYRRANGKVECRLCRAAASQRYRARIRAVQ